MYEYITYIRVYTRKRVKTRYIRNDRPGYHAGFCFLGSKDGRKKIYIICLGARTEIPVLPYGGRTDYVYRHRLRIYARKKKNPNVFVIPVKYKTNKIIFFHTILLNVVSAQTVFERFTRIVANSRIHSASSSRQKTKDDDFSKLL